MKTFITLIFSAFTILCPVVAPAQKVWTLEQCINYALDNNIQLKRKALQTEIASNNYCQSIVALLPYVGAGADHQFNSGKALNQDAYKWENNSFQNGSVGIQGQVTLFSGFRNINLISYYQLNLNASIANLEKAKNDLSLNIAATYLQSLFNKELLDIANGQLDVTKQQVEKYTKLVEVGNAARGSLLEIQAQAATEQVNVTNAANNLALSLLSLAQSLDLDTVKDFNIAEPKDLDMAQFVLPGSAQNIYAIAVQHLPEIKSADMNLRSAGKMLAAEKGNRYPSLTLKASYYSRYNELAIDPLHTAEKYAYRTQLKDNQYKELGLNLSVPIFNKWTIQTQIANAKINYLDAKLNYDLSLQILYKEIEQACADARASLDNLKSRTDAVAASEESFKYVQQKFDVGMVNSVDYNIAKNNLTKAKSDLVQAKYQFIFKTKILDFYQGKEIKL